MGLLDSILGSEGPGALAKQFGLSDQQVGSVLGEMVPALGKGVQRNVQKPGGLEALMGALGTGDHARSIDDPAALLDPATTQDGNAILGHLLGSKDESRALAASVSRSTGVEDTTLKKMLPLAASLLMGSLSKNRSRLAEGGGASGLLAGLLGGEGGGGMADTVAGLVKKLF